MSDVQIDRSSLVAAVAAPFERALVRIGEREVDQIKEDISIPVERDAAGNVIRRSAPGERPRLEHGELQGGIGYRVDTVEGLPQLTIYAARPPLPADEPHEEDAAQVLEFGGGPFLPRPFMRPSAERITTYAVDIVADELRDT